MRLYVWVVLMYIVDTTLLYKLGLEYEDKIPASEL